MSTADRPYSWGLSVMWLTAGLLVSMGLSSLLSGFALLLMSMGGVLAALLAWNSGLCREMWAVLIGATGLPLAMLWAARYELISIVSPPDDDELRLLVPFLWEPWALLAVALPAAGIVASLQSASRRS